MGGDFLGHIGGDEGLENVVDPIDVHEQQAAYHEGHEHVRQSEHVILHRSEHVNLREVLVPACEHAAVPEGQDSEPDPGDDCKTVADEGHDGMAVVSLSVHPREGQEHVREVVAEQHEDAYDPHVQGVREEDEEGTQRVVQQVLVEAALGLDEHVAEVPAHVLPELDIVEHLHPERSFVQIPMVEQ